jgi:TonB-dependent SusC/RagA subfamily outer membrane receptor
MTNQPLVYVDGVRVQSQGGFAPGVGGGSIGDPSALANINFDAIERIEVLKGPAAATLYGSQANAGVIQIFTKQGSQETAPQIDIELGIK